ncbi:MAG: DNA primase [Alphaproteobacteria bacterium]|nr:DNA primase [Alphaproteobacteria bacterium]
MSFLPSFLEEIRNRLPLSGIVGARIRMVRAGREFKGCCPFHNEKTPSFYVNDDKQFFHCFGCGAHGDVIGFLMRYEHQSFPEAVETLAAQAGLQVPRDTPVEREKFDAEKRLYLLLEKATAWFEEQLFLPAGKEGLAYLQSRGLADEAIRRFRLGYAPNDGQSLIRAMCRDGTDFKPQDLVTVGLAKKAEDRGEHYSFFRHRVIFPVGDRRGRTVAFGGRVLGDGEPKYLNSPDHALFHKGHLLYGLSRARTALSQGQPIVVVEGYMDVIALVEAGYSGAVAPLGTALTEDQMQVLWKLAPPLESRDASRDYSPILCFDGDNAGLRAAARAVDRALPLISSAQTLRIATITGAKDPDELIRKSGKAAFDGILKQALPMIDMLWNLSLARRQIRTPEERGAFTAMLRQRVNQIKDEPLRELYKNELKKRIDENFGWKPSAELRRGRNADAMQKPYMGSRRPPQDRHRAREKILLALMVNHPELFNEFGENFALVDFYTPAFEALRQKIVDLLSQGYEEKPTLSELRRALAASDDPFAYDGSRGVLDEVLSSSTYMGAGKAAHPDALLDDAREAWKAIWASIEEEKVEAERLQRTKDVLAN